MNTSLEELAGLVFDALPQAVIVADRSGAIVLRNAAADEMLPAGGEVPAVLRGDSSPFSDWPAVLAALDEAQGWLTEQGVSLPGRDGAQLMLGVHLLSIEKGKFSGVVIVVEDVSAAASMQRKVTANERLAAGGELAARLAHELNNPLDGVMRYIGLAQRAKGRKAGRYLQHARDGLARIAEIISDLGRSTSRARTAPLEKLLTEAVSAMQPRAEALGVTIVCDMAPEASSAIDIRIFQVFCNVIRNALDAMAGGGLLRIRLRWADGRCVVEFADTGCGLGAADAERIFEPFYTTKPPGKGTGLGLAICREILARFGGTITAAPGREGGTLVTVNVPAANNKD